MALKGLRPDGTIAGEGGLDRVQPEFLPVVEAARAEIAARVKAGRLRSVYLYGSIPRGAAVPGVHAAVR